MPWGRPGDELWAEIYYQRELKWYTRHGALPRGREARSGIRRASARRPPRISDRRTRGAGMAHRLDPLLRPQSIAVLGASERAGTVGRNAVENLLQGRIRGRPLRGQPGPQVRARRAVLSVARRAA